MTETFDSTTGPTEEPGGAPAPRRRRRAASRPAGPPPEPTAEELAQQAADEAAAAEAASAAAQAEQDTPDVDETQAVDDDQPDEAGSETVGESETVTDELAGTGRPTPTDETLPDPSFDAGSTDEPEQAPSRGRRRRRSTSRDALTDVAEATGETPPTSSDAPGTDAPEPAEQPEEQQQPSGRSRRRRGSPPVVTFQPPEVAPVTRRSAPERDDNSSEDTDADVRGDASATSDDGRGSGPSSSDDETPGNGTRRRRRGRRGRGRVREDGDEGDDSTGDAQEAGSSPRGQGRAQGGADDDTDGPGQGDEPDSSDSADGADQGPQDENDQDDAEGSGTRRRRRRRRRGGGDGDGGGDAASSDDPPNTVVHVRQPRSTSSAGDEGVRGVTGSTRLEAKRQRRRDGRDQGRKRVPIATEAEFLARREAVERVMVVRNAGERTQIAVLEDGVLVEHYVTRASSAAYAGNVYLGRVQNVLPGMEAAFVDIGKGRNGVLYAGEVNYDASGLEGKPRKIEQALKSGQGIVVQVTKDPIGHKGARLTSQVSLPGRYMVYVPEGGSAGISRKLPDTERTRLRGILKKITPEDAGVIVRTAAEGASEEELGRDIERLSAQWEQIKKKSAKASAPALLYAEPDLVIRVVRDVFNEDFSELVVQGEQEWTQIEHYVESVAPDLMPRVRKHAAVEDVFVSMRIDEQLLKALDRKVYLPSGGSLVFDRTEAMTVVDVNTGRFTGKGTNNLEETVTRNNLEAAEELVRQLRLRDVGGMIVVDFIDMVLESNRDLVLRRLTECLGRDRTKHQVAEVTTLGLVQMTRKRVGQGLHEAYAEPCAVCEGRGYDIELPSPKARPIPRPPAAPARKETGEEQGADEGWGAADAATTAADQPDDAAGADAVVEGGTDPGEPGQDEGKRVDTEVAGVGGDIDADTDTDTDTDEVSAVESEMESDTEPEPEPEPTPTPRRRGGRRRASAPAGAPEATNGAAADSAPSDSTPVDTSV